MSLPDPNTPLPLSVLGAVWRATDIAEHFSFAFIDSLREGHQSRSGVPLARIVSGASPDALAYALAAWINACTAAYQPPKPPKQAGSDIPPKQAGSDI